MVGKRWWWQERKRNLSSIFDEDVVLEVFLHVGLGEAHDFGHDAKIFAREVVHQFVGHAVREGPHDQNRSLDVTVESVDAHVRQRPQHRVLLDVIIPCQKQCSVCARYKYTWYSSFGQIFLEMHL